MILGVLAAVLTVSVFAQSVAARVPGSLAFTTRMALTLCGGSELLLDSAGSTRAVIPPSSVRLMFLGDSVTQGAAAVRGTQSSSSFRRPLFKLLNGEQLTKLSAATAQREAGRKGHADKSASQLSESSSTPLPFVFVGPFVENRLGPSPDSDFCPIHASIWEATTTSLLHADETADESSSAKTSLSGWVRRFAPDVVFVLLGGSDIARAYYKLPHDGVLDPPPAEPDSPAAMLTRLEALLARVLAARLVTNAAEANYVDGTAYRRQLDLFAPRVVLSTLLPTSQPHQREIEAFNEAVLRSLVPGASNAASDVALGEQSSASLHSPGDASAKAHVAQPPRTSRRLPGEPGVSPFSHAVASLLLEWLPATPPSGSAVSPRNASPTRRKLRQVPSNTGVDGKAKSDSAADEDSVINANGIDMSSVWYKMLVMQIAEHVQSMITVVDAGHGLTPETDLYDGVHPNHEGEVVVARNIQQTLLRLRPLLDELKERRGSIDAQAKLEESRFVLLVMSGVVVGVAILIWAVVMATAILRRRQAALRSANAGGSSGAQHAEGQRDGITALARGGASPSSCGGSSHRMAKSTSPTTPLSSASPTVLTHAVLQRCATTFRSNASGDPNESTLSLASCSVASGEGLTSPQRSARGLTSPVTQRRRKPEDATRINVVPARFAARWQQRQEQLHSLHLQQHLQQQQQQHPVQLQPVALLSPLRSPDVEAYGGLSGSFSEFRLDSFGPSSIQPSQPHD